MVIYHPNILNKHIAPDITDFTNALIPDIAATHSESSHWLSNHFLNSVVGELGGKKYKEQDSIYVMNAVLRTQTAFSLYHQARESTLDYLKDNNPHNPKLRQYYKAITEWESCFLNLHIFVDVLKKWTGRKVFVEGDNSPEDRAYSIANKIKHWAGDIKNNKHQVNDSIPLWLTNTGFQTREHRLTYSELSTLIDGAAKVCQGLSSRDPTLIGGIE